jgi:hypothetical protein
MEMMGLEHWLWLDQAAGRRAGGPSCFLPSQAAFGDGGLFLHFLLGSFGSGFRVFSTRFQWLI